MLWQMGVAAQRRSERLMAHALWRQAVEILDPMGCTEATQLRRLLADEHGGGDQPAATPIDTCA